LWINETTTTHLILDLREVHFINLEIQFTYVVLAITLEPRLVRQPNCCNGYRSLLQVNFLTAPCHLARIALLMSRGGPNIEPRSDHQKTPFSVARCLLSRIIATTERYCCAYALLWECCCIATDTCRLVLLRTVAISTVIDVHNMWEDSMEGSHAHLY
jgi:hypothetical protein